MAKRVGGLVRILNEASQQLRAGDRWRMDVRLKAPHGNISSQLGLARSYAHDVELGVCGHGGAGSVGFAAGWVLAQFCVGGYVF